MSVVAAAPPVIEKITKRRLWLILGALLLGMLLAALDQTIVSTALPTIVGDLHGGSHLAWVVTAYLLSSTVSTPLWGKLGDQYGRKIFFQAAIVIFVIGSALAGFSHTMTELIAFRALQGLGGGGLMVGAQTIIGDVVSPARPGPLHGAVRCHVRRGHGDRAADRRAVRDVPVVALGLLHQPAARDPRPVRDRRRAARPPAPGVGHTIDYAGALLLAASATSLIIFASLGGISWAWVVRAEHRHRRRSASCWPWPSSWPSGGGRAGDPAEALPGAGLQRGQRHRLRHGIRHVRGARPSSRCSCRTSRA